MAALQSLDVNVILNQVLKPFLWFFSPSCISLFSSSSFSSCCYCPYLQLWPGHKWRHLHHLEIRTGTLHHTRAYSLATVGPLLCHGNHHHETWGEWDSQLWPEQLCPPQPCGVSIPTDILCKLLLWERPHCPRNSGTQVSWWCQAILLFYLGTEDNLRDNGKQESICTGLGKNPRAKTHSGHGIRIWGPSYMLKTDACLPSAWHTLGLTINPLALPSLPSCSLYIAPPQLLESHSSAKSIYNNSFYE